MIRFGFLLLVAYLTSPRETSSSVTKNMTIHRIQKWLNVIQIPKNLKVLQLFVVSLHYDKQGIVSHEPAPSRNQHGTNDALIQQ